MPETPSEFAPDTAMASDTPRPRFGRMLMIGGAVLAVVLVGGTVTRLHARSELADRTADAAITSVKIIQPGGNAADELVLPGRLQAWNLAPVYARTNGYVRRWHADIGQRVRAGQLLAEIDTPEVDQQLAAAKAALGTADAQLSLARTTTERWQRMVEKNAVSQQDADEREGAFAAREAMRNEAAANLGRLQTLSGFKRIVAPFNGVVTSRSTELGQLVVAGTSTTQPLFTVADVDRLRIYVSVPQNYSAQLTDGLDTSFTVPDFPGRTFHARLVRTADAVDPASGTMLTQLVFDNRGGVLKPGSYAQVTFDLGSGGDAAGQGAIRIPVSAMLFRREGASVAVMDENRRIHIRPIEILTDYGTELEVTGIARSDNIVDSPPDDIMEGQQVRPIEPAKGAKADA